MAYKWLRTYPTLYKPETWPLNDIYVELLNRTPKALSDAYIELKFGLEMEFALHTLEGFDATYTPGMISRQRFLAINPQSEPTYDARDRLIAWTYSHTPFERGAIYADDLIKYVRKSPSLKTYLKELDLTRDEIITQLQDFKSKLTDKDTGISEHALSNICAAYMHVLPPRLGGLRGIVMSSFGSNILGVGWWDGPSTLELRLPPTSNTHALINDYHTLVNRVYQIAEKFQLIPQTDEGSPHIHTSVWYKLRKNGKPVNAMAGNTDNDRFVKHRAIAGLYAAFGQAPHLINDCIPGQKDEHVDLETSHTKGCSLRQTANTVELRRNAKGNTIHLARDLGLISTGIIYGLRAPEMRKHAGVEKVLPGMIEGLVEVPIVEDIYGREFDNSFMHLVELARRGKDECLCIDGSQIADNVDIYLGVIGGPEKAGLFTCRMHGKKFDLRYADTWQAMMESIKVRSDGMLDVAHLHEDLRPHLERLRIKGWRMVVKAKDVATLYGPTSIHQNLETLNESSFMTQIFSEPTRRKFKEFYEQRATERQKGVARAALHEMLFEFEMEARKEKPAEDLAPAIRRNFNLLVSRAMREETNRAAVPAAFVPERAAPTLETLRNATNPLKELKPHFFAAVQEHADILRASGKADNYMLSALAQTADMFENSLTDISNRHMVENASDMNFLTETMLGITNFHAFSDYLGKGWFKNLRTRVHFALAAGTPVETVIKQLGDCRATADQIVEKFKEGPNADMLRFATHRGFARRLKRCYKLVTVLAAKDSHAQYENLIVYVRELASNDAQNKTGALAPV